MVSVVKSVIANMLAALYQPFWFAIVLSVFFMFTWKNYHSIKDACIQWIKWFRTEASFRKMFFLTFYTVMILFQTLFNRIIWLNPLANVLGVWGLHKLNSAGELILTTEVLENLALFIPFSVLLFWTYKDRLLGEKVSLWIVVRKSAKYVFLFSLNIEFLQLFLRVGTWQLSDIFYNTLGGIIGGFIYWSGYRITVPE